MICDLCDNEEDVRHCNQCGMNSCGSSRLNPDICPRCGASVAVNASCSTTGGCGTGSQEEP